MLQPVVLQGDLVVPADCPNGVKEAVRQNKRFYFWHDGVRISFDSATAAPLGVKQAGTCTISTVNGVKSCSDFTPDE